MEHEHLLSIFRDSGALLEGHFQLTSGLHSNRYFQCARVLQFPHYTELLCSELAHQFRPAGIDVVIAPALGGIVVGQEVGRQLRARTLFAERKEGVMQLRRGFDIAPGEKVLVCEDVVTTGGSVSEVISLVRSRGGNVAGVAFIVDRSGGKVKFPLDPGGLQCSLMAMDVVAYPPSECPLCAQGLPVVKPGSRGNA
ncbi:MAG TPA: orotate phosphoribosyltransferase [Bacteroidota bacterium]|nr:orotate phosphoribosyltransferase [Bacteroidota bacterium]